MTLEPATGDQSFEPDLLEDDPHDLYEHAPCGYLSTTPDGTIVKANLTFARWTGHDRERLVGTTKLPDLLTTGGRIYFETHYRPLLEMQDSVQEISFDLLHADGRHLPVLVNSTLLRAPDGRPRIIRTTVFDATDRRSYEKELLRARRHAERLHRHHALLAEAGRALNDRRDVDGRASGLLQVLTEDLAEVAVLQLADSAGPIAVSGDTSDPLLQEMLAEVLEGGSARVTGDPLSSRVAAVPVQLDEDTVGGLALKISRAGEGLADDELPLLVAIADRTAVALDNARLYEREHTVALALQRAMLAGEFPADPRCTIGSFYSAAVETLEVGGDFYDAFSTGPDRVHVSVGDVVGKGLDAAATMGQLRSALRALAVSGMSPSQILESLDRLVPHTPNSRGATVALADLDLSTGKLRLACAGHPPPILLDENGTHVIWDGRSGPLGARIADVSRLEAELTLQPGARIIFYTDGAVERRDRAIDVGIERLRDAFEQHRDHPVGPLAETLNESLLSDQQGSDDVCLLALMFAADSRFESQLIPDVHMLSALRADLGGWLAAHGIGSPARDESVLACSELAANSIEHGRAGRVVVTATLEGDFLALRVADDGTWRDPDPGSVRGRGTMITRALVDELSIEHDDSGTRADLRKRIRGHG